MTPEQQAAALELAREINAGDVVDGDTSPYVRGPDGNHGSVFDGGDIESLAALAVAQAAEIGRLSAKIEELEQLLGLAADMIEDPRRLPIHKSQLEDLAKSGAIRSSIDESGETTYPIEDVAKVFPWHAEKLFAKAIEEEQAQQRKDLSDGNG